jgi:hypothetical protein
MRAAGENALLELKEQQGGGGRNLTQMGGQLLRARQHWGGITGILRTNHRSGLTEKKLKIGSTSLSIKEKSQKN